MAVGEIIKQLLGHEGEPRDGITILGGEPFLQSSGLFALMRALRQRGESH